MDNRTFANQFLEPKRTGNFIKDLNPLSKLNIFLAFGLSALILGDYRYGFGLVVFMLVVAVLAQCLSSYLKVYWKILLFVRDEGGVLSGRADHMAEMGDPRLGGKP